ncbi:hypothetical protein [Gluconacetobacter takamatsuzukensis]|uniref:Uncharacterized protein n=1 Tax=Gluconacetobacter takamatsuzukensis TaxID=1286190 RepID=A0A7W4KE65_9PROT|nr:hypothetical protein [Gluconacetobacter takamatsuzukensis]MBB2205251.1 hypothetical protein [Gluconacetobacter takamatsuzukensis]
MIETDGSLFRHIQDLPTFRRGFVSGAPHAVPTGTTQHAIATRPEIHTDDVTRRITGTLFHHSGVIQPSGFFTVLEMP